MSRAVGRDDRVSRQRNLMTLQVLLQQGLGILAERARIDMVEDRHIQALDDRLRRLEPAIEKDRAQNGFQRVSKKKPMAAMAKSSSERTALVQTGEYSAVASSPTTASFTPASSAAIDGRSRSACQ